ncbi:MAG: CPBP family intramembrane metalloprotease [Chloroflexi bacterium]|nr:MAG: CPBP family intramembrane metalloprotease [Chloroflexota bacterium]
MTAPAASRSGSAGQRAILLSVGLGAAALARAALNGTGATSAYLAGTGFGAALLCLAFAAGWRPARPRLVSVGLGVLGGLILVGLPLLASPSTRAVTGMRPEPFVAWLVVTALVVTAEEVLLRGALLPALDEAAGPIVAVVASSAAFALMHVPLYGWGVVPIDLAAGVWLAGLRYLSGGVAAPTLAHLLADLATWWL